MPLTNEHAFHLIHTLTTLASSTSDKLTFSIEFVHSLISTLNPCLSTIIQTEHEPRDNRHPWIQSHFYPHKFDVPRQSILPINFLKRPNHFDPFFLLTLDNDILVVIHGVEPRLTQNLNAIYSLPNLASIFPVPTMHHQ